MRFALDRLGGLWRRPPAWAAWALGLVLVAVWGWLRLGIFGGMVLPLTFALPLLVNLWTRQRGLLWVMAGCFALMTVVRYPWMVSLLAVEQWATVGANLVSILVSAGITDWLILLLNRHDQQAAALDRTAAQWQQLAESMPALVWTCRPNGDCDYLSQQWAAYTGLPAEQQLGCGWLNQVHPEDRASLQQAWARAVQHQTPFEAEFRIRRQDGVYRWFLTHATAVRDANGELLKWYGANTDIEELKQTSLALRRSAQFPEENPNPVLRVDAADQVLYTNAAGRDLLQREGWQSGQAVPAVFAELLHRCRSGQPLCEVELSCQANRFFWFTAIRPAGERYVNLYGNETTARRQAEQAARQNEQRLRAIFHNAGVGIVEVEGAADRIVQVNQRLAEMLGYRPEELIGSTIHELTDPADQAESDRRNAELRVGASGCLEYDKRYRRRDQSPLWVHVTVCPVRSPAGGHQRSIATVINIDHRKKTEAALRDSEERFRLLADNISQFAWMADPHGWIFWYNRRWYDFTGTTPEQVRGWGWRQLHHPEHVQRVVEKFSRCLATGTPWEDTFPLRGRDGQYRWFLSRARPIRDPNGQVVRWFGTNTDITDQRQARKEAERSAAELLALYDALQDPVIMYDETGQPVRTNHASIRLLGLDVASGSLESYRQLMNCLEIRRPDGQRVAFAELPSQRALHGELVRAEDYILSNANGRRVTVSVSAAPLQLDGRLIGVVAAWHDITDRERLLQQLRELTTNLERRVEERTAELSASNRDLEAFTYTVAHDLRAPLRHVLGFVELLGRRLEPKTADSREYMQAIREATLRMGQLIDDLLGFARLGRIELHKQPVAIGALVEQARQTLAASLAQRTVQWRIGPLPTVAADPSLLQQALVNLLDNSLKFTRPRPEAVIEIGSYPAATEQVIYVRDNGVGFDMQYAGKLFGVFQRLHDHRQFEGTGVGLAHVQRILQRHGGRAWAESQPDQGTTIYLALPK